MQRTVFIILFFGLCFGLLAEAASAQLLRRQLQRIPAVPRWLSLNEQGYQVGPAQRQGPIIQGDGRAGERVMNIIGLFTGANSELKPVAVVSFASFDDFQRTTQVVAQEVRLDKGSADEPVLLNLALDFYGRIVGQGFDTSQPFGIVVQTDGVLFYPIMFTPLNLDSNIGRLLKNRYAEQLTDGRTAIKQEIFRWPLGRLYVQEHNGWAFIAPENLLNSLPDDPTFLLQGLDKTALAAARFDLQNLPAASTRTALSLAEARAVVQAESEIDKAFARLTAGYLRSIAEQADFLEYRIAYDEEQNEFVWEQTEIVKPNTERATLHQQRRNAESKLHGFYHPEGAILASHLVMSLTNTQRIQCEIILDEAVGKHLLSEEERNALKETRVSTRRVRTASRTPLTELHSSEELEGIAEPETSEIIEPIMPEMVRHEEDLARSPTDLTDSQKLEMLLRRIGATYYWALIGAVRSGQFDGASTWSQEHGMLAAYNIADGERFLRAFDAVFEEMQESFPEWYEKSVKKDYAESEGFRLSSVTFRLGDFVKNPFVQSITPPNFSDRETRLILGVRKDAVCFAVGQGLQPEKVLVEAISGTRETKPVDDLFFIYSAYELGQVFASSGQPARFARLKLAAADTNPYARAYAFSDFTETTKTITVRVSGLLTPSLWRMREAMW